MHDNFYQVLVVVVVVGLVVEVEVVGLSVGVWLRVGKKKIAQVLTKKL